MIITNEKNLNVYSFYQGFYTLYHKHEFIRKVKT